MAGKKQQDAMKHGGGTAVAESDASGGNGEATTAPVKVKRQYFCEGTGVAIDHKARFGGMGYDAQLKSRLVNAALVGGHGVRYDNATGEAIEGPAEQLLADLGWSGFLVKARESRAAKTAKKEAKAAAKLSAEADADEGEDAEDE
jgi:hypothetical protein